MAVWGNTAALGFWLQDHALEAALIHRRRRGWKTAGEGRAEEDGLLVSDNRRARLTSAFRTCLKRLPRGARRADLGAVLALPDRWVEEDLLSFADFPKARKEARTLVAHRMARELNVPVGDLAVSWEVCPTKDSAVTCRVRAMNKALCDDIEAAAAKAGLRLVRIDGWSGFASGAPELLKHPNGAAVWTDGTTWSLLCWGRDDSAGFLQHGRAVQGTSPVSDLVRLCQSYAKANAHEELPVFAAAPDDIVTELATAARAAGLTASAFSEASSRSAQVAGWG